MLRTILLLDGSAIMNSAADYLPSYCLALRTPILQCVAEYLDSTPLATLGAVVMRDGVSRRLSACTSNSTEIADVLERDYFLVGGSGVFSLENGLRMAMSELVDLRKVRAAATRAEQNNSNNSAKSVPHDPTRLRVLLISASVTLIDPTDVIAVLKLMAQMHIEVHCVSLCGAVHVFDEAARLTGGAMHCPLNFGHLQSILHQLALELAVVGRRQPVGRRQRALRLEQQKQKQQKREARKRARAASSHADEQKPSHELTPDEDEDETGDDGNERLGTEMIPIGFPLYAQPSAGEAGYLMCPQCHLIQMAIPTMCRLCGLQLCSVPILYAGFVRHSQYALLAPTTTTTTATTTSTVTTVKPQLDTPKASVISGEPTACRCVTCQQPLPRPTTASAEAAVREGGPEKEPNSSSSSSRASVQCTACQCWRCALCDVYVRENLGLCPTCLTSA